MSSSFVFWSKEKSWSPPVAFPFESPEADSVSVVCYGFVFGFGLGQFATQITKLVV
jgi:hypothetical protein